MFPTFGGGGGAADDADVDTDGVRRVSTNFERMETEIENLEQPVAASGALSVGLLASSSAFSSFSERVSSNAPTADQLHRYMAGVASFAADAKLGMQVARVRLGLDAQVRKACDSPALARLGPASAALCPASLAPTAGDPAEPEGMEDLVSTSMDSQQHLKVVLSAMQDYQRHRQGMAEAGHRLALALQEAGQRSPGAFGEALGVCGQAHQQAATARREACAAEELHVLSKLRAHDGKASSDCRRAVRQYKAALQELRLLRRARLQAQVSKQAASGDSFMAPTVEENAARLEEVALQKLREAGERAEGKLHMFQAKHSADYASSIAAHVACVADEERRVAEALAEAVAAADVVRRSVQSD